MKVQRSFNQNWSIYQSKEHWCTSIVYTKTSFSPHSAQKFQNLISGYQTPEDIPGGPVHRWSQQQHKHHQHHHKQKTNTQTKFPTRKMLLCNWMKNRPVIGISLAFIIHFDHVPSETLLALNICWCQKRFLCKKSYKGKQYKNCLVRNIPL